MRAYMQPFWLNASSRPALLRPALAPRQLIRSDLGHMTDKLEAKFAQLVKDAGCPQDFKKWLVNQKLLTIESFGVAAPNEVQLSVEVTNVAKSEGVKFETLGEKSCVAKLGRVCRNALEAGPSAGIARVVPDPEQGFGEGAEDVIKDLWLTRHIWALSDIVLVVRPLIARLHRELTAASPVLGSVCHGATRHQGLP